MEQKDPRFPPGNTQENASDLVASPLDAIWHRDALPDATKSSHNQRMLLGNVAGVEGAKGQLSRPTQGMGGTPFHLPSHEDINDSVCHRGLIGKP